MAKINLMATILLQQAVYDQFYACPSDVLEDEISRTSIRLRLQDAPKSDQERNLYQSELDRLTTLKYISQLRKGKLSRQEFDLKVKLAVNLS